MSAPQSFRWLLAHEIRLALRSIGGRKGMFAKAVPVLLLASLPIGGGIALAALLSYIPDRAPNTAALAIASYALVGVLLFMTPNAAANVLRTFHDRADLDLVLTAPVPPHRILAAKAVRLYASVATPFLFLFGPFLLASAALGHLRYLGALGMILVLAVAATGLAFVVARLAYRAFGARRARVLVQVGAGLMGAVVFITFQAQNIAPETSKRLLRAALHTHAPPPPWDIPARAAFGAPGPLAVMFGLAALGAWAATRVAARTLTEPESEAPRARALADARPVFRSGLARIVTRKELRLLARDPELLAQITLRMVFLLPIVALVFRGGAGFDAPRVAAACTMFAGTLAASLAWLTISAEDAPELIAAAPVLPGTVARAKLIAACGPPVAVAAVPAIGVGIGDPWAGAVAVIMAGVAGLSAALLQDWYGKPARRSSFKRRQQGSFVLGIGELALTLGWAGTAGLLARGSPWAIGPAIIACAILYAGAEARPLRV